ncbi:GH25 family lysozyme [Limosilactobacillus coleohominis]|uniref:GH25 family lysozyme n=1 Tax=Limosilactobacillus coleohominis TaxID=181675 RepID=UPI00195DB265|nr:GH25 family lysozyme [Limosilactobacillus coleohominis]MBM6954618.1 hypothetical protein [Limosilactobacillus coleohominis]
MPKQANAIDISEFQDPSTFDYQAAKDAGIDTIIIRGSVSQRLDKAAKQHIANAKKYGFKWHLYHYFYNGSNEINVAINSAKELGLTSGQYLFLDMEDKSLPSDWADLFEQFRSAVGNQFKVGLYCSDSPYKAKFDNNKLVNENVYRWIAAYSYEPKNYDMWQMSGAGSGGFGSYNHDVDRDYMANNALNAYANSPEDKTFTPPTDLPEQTKNIVLQDMVVNGIRGLGCSPDNGVTNRIYWTIFGRKYYQEDGDHIWPFIVGKVRAIKGGASNVSWNDIQNKPDVALKSDLPDMSNYVTRNELPTMPDLSGYAKKSDIPDVTNLNQVVTVTSGTLADLATKNGTYHYEIDCSPTDAPVADWGLCDVVVGEHYAKQTFTNTGNKSGDSYLRIRDYDGKWSDWREVTLWQ